MIKKVFKMRGLWYRVACEHAFHVQSHDYYSALLPSELIWEAYLQAKYRTLRMRVYYKCCSSLIINTLAIFQTTKINQAACDLAKGVAQEGGALFAGSICQTAFLYSSGAGKEVVMKKFREQIQIFLQNGVDLLIAEVSYLLT